MNWKKKKDTPEAQTPEAAAAGKGPVPFLKKNWKWLVPVLCVAVQAACSCSGPSRPSLRVWMPATRRPPRSAGM